MKKTFLVLAVLVLLIGGYFWSTYNSLITPNEAVTAQWAKVEAQYQRRFDLIPGLVESVKAVMTQEQEVFKALAEARTRYAGAANANEKVNAANAVEGSLARLLVVMENYPQLKSSETTANFMVQLEGTENRIATERGRYNETVQAFNTMIKKIPTKWIASLFGFELRSYFEADKGAEKAPAVNFDLKN